MAAGRCCPCKSFILCFTLFVFTPQCSWSHPPPSPPKWVQAICRVHSTHIEPEPGPTSIWELYLACLQVHLP